MTARLRVSPCVPAALSEDARVVLNLLKAAMTATGWTYEALIAEMKRVGVTIPDRQYVGKMLSGEKPINVKQIVAFPDDLEAAFLARWSEYKGLLVIARVSDDDARRQLATGLFSLITTHALPTHAGPPVRAGLSPAPSSARSRVRDGS